MAVDHACSDRLVTAPRIDKICDFVGRFALVGLFGALATNQTLGAIALFQSASETRFLDLAIAFASIFFTAVVVGLTIMRIDPIRSAIGVEPRVSALGGAFLSIALIALAPTDL